MVKVKITQNNNQSQTKHKQHIKNN